MKPFLPRILTARLLPVVVALLAISGVCRLRAQQYDSNGFYEQGDEMSKRVGGFFRKLFYGEDRNEAGYSQQQQGQRYRPQQVMPTTPAPPYRPPVTPQPREYSYSSPSQGAGPHYNSQPQGPTYQYAPPPGTSVSDDSEPPAPRPHPTYVPPEPPAPTPRKQLTHTPEPDKPKHRDRDRDKDRDKDKDRDTTPRPASKRPVVQDTPPKHVAVPDSPPKRVVHDTPPEEPAPKTLTKKKSYTPPTVAGDDPPEPKPKKLEPAHKEAVVKAPVQDQPPGPLAKTNSEPDSGNATLPPHHSNAKEDPANHVSGSDSANISPYAENYAGSAGSSPTTLKAPSQPKIEPKSEPKPEFKSEPKTDEPKKREKKESEPPAPASNSGEPKFPTGTRSDHAGRVVSPYPPHNELDVSGLPSGSLAVDPTTSKVFRVP